MPKNHLPGSKIFSKTKNKIFIEIYVFVANKWINNEKIH